MSWRQRTCTRDGWINWWEWMPERIWLEHEGRDMLTYLVHLHHWWGNHNNHPLISQLLGIIVQRSWKSPYEISQGKIILMLWSVAWCNMRNKPWFEDVEYSIWIKLNYKVIMIQHTTCFQSFMREKKSIIIILHLVYCFIKGRTRWNAHILIGTILIRFFIPGACVSTNSHTICIHWFILGMRSAYSFCVSILTAVMATVSRPVWSIFHSFHRHYSVVHYHHCCIIVVIWIWFWTRFLEIFKLGCWSWNLETTFSVVPEGTLSTSIEILM